MSELIKSVENGVALLTLNRPDTLNALNVSLHHELKEALFEIEADRHIGCVVLTGAGRGFCSGGDLNAIKARDEGASGGDPNSPNERKAGSGGGVMGRMHMVREHTIASRLLHNMGKPTIAMINGACAGAGLSLAGACDLRFAGRKAVFLSAFTGIGLSGDGGGSWFWTQILGTSKARELYLLNEKYDAERALQFGLVNRLFDDETLHEQTMAIATRIAGGQRPAYELAKNVLNAAEDGSFESVLDREALAMALVSAARRPKRPE